jgi:hypothetical protein
MSRFLFSPKTVHGALDHLDERDATSLASPSFSHSVRFHNFKYFMYTALSEPQKSVLYMLRIEQVLSQVMNEVFGSNSVSSSIALTCLIVFFFSLCSKETAPCERLVATDSNTSPVSPGVIIRVFVSTCRPHHRRGTGFSAVDCYCHG